MLLVNNKKAFNINILITCCRSGCDDEIPEDVKKSRFLGSNEEKLTEEYIAQLDKYRISIISILNE